MFFVLGRGRSGTTLLYSMLNLHKRVSIAPEALFIMNLYWKYYRIKNWDQKKIISFYNDLWKEKRLENWNLDKKVLRNELLIQKEDISFPELCEIVYLNHARAKGKNGNILIGDKNPQYSLYVKNLIKLFPGAKFIHLVREYKDNILSFQKMNFDINNTVALAYRWSKYNKEILKFAKLYPQKFIRVRYEDLLHNPEKELLKICEHLRIDFDPHMLEFFKYQDFKFGKWHDNLKKPLDENNINRWKKSMAKNDVIKSDYICGTVGKSFGYIPEKNSKAIKTFLLTWWMILYGKLITCLEKNIFLLPPGISAKIITFYRKKTGTLKVEEEKK